MTIKQRILAAFISLMLVCMPVLGLASDALSPASINTALVPERTGRVKNNVAHILEPDAIGNGPALLALIDGDLPKRDAPTDRSALAAVRQSIDLAIRLHIQNRGAIPAASRRLADEILSNLILTHTRLSHRLHPYRAVVNGPDDYLLGFDYQGTMGVATDLVERLRSTSLMRLANYVYHLCGPDKAIENGTDDHGTRFRELRAAIFGEDEVAALGMDASDFIDEILSPKSESAPSGGIVIKIAEEFKITDILDAIQRINSQLTFTTNDGTTESYSVINEELMKRCRQGTHTAIYAEDTARHEIIGYAILNNRTPSGKTAHLVYQAVLPPYQKTDVGARIFMRALIETKKNSMDHLVTAPLMDSIDLYRKINARMEHRMGPHFVTEFRPDNSSLENLTRIPLLYSLEDSSLADLEKAAADMLVTEQDGAKKVAASAEDIDADLTYRAELFKAHLLYMLAQHPDKTFVLAVDNNIGKAQQAQMMPLYKAIDQLEGLKNENGERLLPNLVVIRDKGDRLADTIKKTTTEYDKVIVVTTQENLEKDALAGLAGRAWIAALEDRKAGTDSYLPVFETITLAVMAAIGGDADSIKSFYDTIAETPVTPAALDEMLKTKIIRLLPKTIPIDPNALRALYENVRTVYLSA